VAAQYVDKLAAWRITLTPAILNRAGRTLFLVSGAAKSYALQRVIYGAFQPDRFPAQVIQPANNAATWLVDESAASLL
jgi:6-phosphogluconolactonase